jgi:hypothetical protein
MDVLVWVVLGVALVSVLALLIVAATRLIGIGFGATVGNRSEKVDLEYDLRDDSATALQLVLARVSPIMRAARYVLTWQDPAMACFVRRRGLVLPHTDYLLFQLFPAAHAASRLTIHGTLGHQDREGLRETLAGIGDQRRAAGWYPDGSGEERYWDGEAWTEQARPERVVVGPRMRDAPRP